MPDDFNQVMGAANRYVEQFKKDIAQGLVVWKEVQPPKPKAMRAFEGQGNGYMVMVTEANIQDVGKMHHAMLIGTKGGVSMVNLPADLAKLAYTSASRARN